MDGLTLFAAVREIDALIGGKVDKIQQHERDALMLFIHAGGGTQRLLLCAHPEHARVQLTQKSYQNPPEPPAFCMLLRRRLTGGRLLSVDQPNLDRVLHLRFLARDDMGDSAELTLIVELMGRYSNICLINAENAILGCVRHVGPQMSSVRVLLPGAVYQPPPPQEKQNPLEAGEEDFFRALSVRGSLHKLLVAGFFGLSPDSAGAITARWAGETELSAEALGDAERRAFARYLYRLFQSFTEGAFTPTMVYDDTHAPVRLYPFEPAVSSAAHLEKYPSIGTALDAFYEQRDKTESFRRRSASVRRILQNNLERCVKKLALFEQALHQDEDLARMRVYGELIIANAHLLSRGMETASLENYYATPPDRMAIPLDKRLSPQENARQYFKRYQKGKAAKALAVEQCANTREEISYLEGQLNNLELCVTPAELQEIRDELIREGYVKRDPVKRMKQKIEKSKPLHLRSPGGHDLYVGRNNQQNDALTLHFARPVDWWFHTKDIPGAHVILRVEGELAEAALREAAMLAAYYSGARTSASVPVDYCLRKHVKKPAGARPGMVVYTNNRTLYVTPDETAIRAFAVVE